MFSVCLCAPFQTLCLRNLCCILLKNFWGIIAIGSLFASSDKNATLASHIVHINCLFIPKGLCHGKLWRKGCYSSGYIVFLLLGVFDCGAPPKWILVTTPLALLLVFHCNCVIFEFCGWNCGAADFLDIASYTIPLMLMFSWPVVDVVISGKHISSSDFTTLNFKFKLPEYFETFILWFAVKMSKISYALAQTSLSHLVLFLK